jgi:hypothetical protein
LARLSLYAFLAAFALPFLLLASPVRRSDSLLLVIFVGLVSGAASLVSFMLGVFSLVGSRRALLWLLPGALFLALAATTCPFGR